MKQSKLRRRRVTRFAILYYVLFVVFIALIVGPAVAGDKINVKSLQDQFGDGLRIVQPNHQNHKNTNSSSLTGTGNPDYTGVYVVESESDGGGRATDRIRLF